jgi:hypothetical protein
MPRYRIHRIKDAPREVFRWTAHTGGVAIIKPRDYDFSEEVESLTPYAAWKMLASEGRPLRPGDVLETIIGEGAGVDLKIAKYIGFEPAQWWMPEPKTNLDASATALTETSNPAQESHLS